MKKIKFVTLAVLVLAAAYYATYTTYNTKHQLTDLVLLNIEAFAVDDSDYADPIRFKQCYTFTSTTLLPDYPAEYVTCLLYTSPSPPDTTISRMPSSA